MSIHLQPWISDAAFYDDVNYLETRWQRTQVGSIDLPLIDLGQGKPLVFVPILEHLEFVYARQVQTLSQSRRVILYRRQETRNIPFLADGLSEARRASGVGRLHKKTMGLAQRAEELRNVLDSLALEQADLLGHGDAAMVLFEFALRYPQRCRSLIIISQPADYQIAPHPLIWLLHELLLRLPAEYIVPASFLRRTVINYIMAHDKHNQAIPALPRHLIEEQFGKIEQWPFVYKFSVLPIIHYFDIRTRVKELTMPVLLINRADDALAPEAKTQWLAQQLPACKNYHVVAGKERFFLYSQAAKVTPLIESFLASEDAHDNRPGQLQQQEKQ